MSHPKGLAQGANEALLVADSDNNRIRSIANLTSNPSLTLSNYSLDFPNQPLLLPSALAADHHQQRGYREPDADDGRDHRH